jgi:hypothetical protein
MTGLDVLLALAGIGVTVMVIVGMVLITPRGTVEVHAEGADPQGSNRSSTTRSPDRSLSMPTRP